MKKPYFIKFVLLINSLFCTIKDFAQQNETINTGSFIINMGVTPQTINNGLKPYGLVYDLLKNNQVPIKWVINSSKSKDSADFTYNGVQYKGGTFIVPAEFRTTAVNTTINTWISAGVVGVTTVSSITVPVYKTILFVPNWTLDKANGSIAVSFFQNAGIPSTAYGGSSSSGWKDPSQLNSCDDIFVLPHADPTWATHQNLYYWNRDYKGNIWAGCHAVSVLEGLTSGTGIQMNFLSNNGLVLYSNHNNASAPFIYQFPTDPVMQFMSTFDGATTNGSEEVYLPNLSGAWRSGTVLGVYDPSQQNVPAKSPGPAALAIYGRAYSDTTRGFVMYEAGHDLNSGGSNAEKVAAQRAFFNYSFYTTQIKVQLPYIDISPVPQVVKYGDTISLDYSLPPGYNPANYTTTWTSSCGGTWIPNNTTKVTKWVVPTDRSITTCVISVKVKDACNRENFASKSIFLVVNILKNKLGPLTGNLSGEHVHLNWSTLAEQNLSKFIIERSHDGITFVPVGIVNAFGNSSSETNYEYTDNDIATEDNFYRIRSVDEKNNEELSHIIFITGIGNKFGFKLVPNPVTSASNVHIFSVRALQVEISIVDITGKLVHSSVKNISAGETIFDIKELKILQPGVYIIKVNADKEPFFQKVVVLNH